MSSFTLSRMAGLAVGTLLAAAIGLLGAGAAAAQAITNRSTAVACSPSSGEWTDCSITLNESVPAGGTVVASIDSPSSSVAFCWGGTTTFYPQMDGSVLQVPGCSYQGNVVTFICLSACPAGSILQISTLGPSSPTAAAITVQISGI